ncbi:CbtA family protein [Nocardia cyriacigeorgica]|uniref:CbtA family protein n=1 Tax=Nocardia cyriacigeorgica TaxID=135487 RepID=A0A5R8PK98_9NOCA|nr:CbtA family protein [Nocardia cyriacigeorgica]TLG17656.1 CbtA family protein [Nocardia cyriacigeorgica]
MPLIGTLRTLLLRGLLAGLIAGLLAGTVGYFVGEPKVEAAIAIEETNAAAAESAHTGADAADGSRESHGDEEEPLVSRSGQKIGLFLALGLAGMALGAIFGAVAHVARRYTARSGPMLALGIGIGGWAAIVAVPFFKYPANPPAVGNPATMNDRTLLWLAAVLLGLVAVGAGGYVWRLLAGRPDILRLTAGVVAFVLVTAVGYIALPDVNEVTDDFPASLLWQFRISSLAVSTTLWACLGLGYAMLTEFTGRTTAPAERTAASV